jgi:hypothetical protein
VDEKTVDALVRDVLLLIERTDAVGRSADEPEQSVDDPDERATAVDVLLAEETRISMMVGVAVGWALADELGSPTITNDEEES